VEILDAELCADGFVYAVWRVTALGASWSSSRIIVELVMYPFRVYISSVVSNRLCENEEGLG